MTPRRLGPEARASRRQDGPQDLIHTNKPSNPMPMRVSAGSEALAGLSMMDLAKVVSMPPAVAVLMLRRLQIEGAGYARFSP